MKELQMEQIDELAELRGQVKVLRARIKAIRQRLLAGGSLEGARYTGTIRHQVVLKEIIAPVHKEFFHYGD